MPGGNPNHDPKTGMFTSGAVGRAVERLGRAVRGFVGSAHSVGLSATIGQAVSDVANRPRVRARAEVLRSHIAGQHGRDTGRLADSTPSQRSAARLEKFYREGRLVRPKGG